MNFWNRLFGAADNESNAFEVIETAEVRDGEIFKLEKTIVQGKEKFFIRSYKNGQLSDTLCNKNYTNEPNGTVDRDGMIGRSMRATTSIYPSANIISIAKTTFKRTVERYS